MTHVDPNRPTLAEADLARALRESEERFRAVFDNAAVGKAIVGPDLRYRHVNRAYVEMFGYSLDELLCMSPDELTAPDDPGDNADLMRRIVSGELASGRVLKKYRCKDGSTRWGDLTLTVHRDLRAQMTILGEVIDVTAQRNAEVAVRESEERFRRLYELAPIMMTVVGPDGCFRDVSRDWLERMGYRREEVIGRPGHEFVSAESHGRIVEACADVVRRGERVVHLTPVVALRKDGTSMDVLATNLLELDEAGNFLGGITIGMDVGELRRAEEAARESEARYRALVEHAPEAITVLDVERGLFVDCNPPAESLFGRGRDEILGLGPLDFCPRIQPDGTPSEVVARREIERVASGGAASFEFTCSHASGRDFPCQIRLTRLPDKEKFLIRSSITDLSEIKLLHENVRHADRMTAIGVLAAGVAHEIGNPLLALSMAIQNLERKAHDEYTARKLTLVREHIDRISRIVRQMSDLARTPTARRTTCELDRIVERALEIFRYDRRAKDVELTFIPGSEAAVVHGSEDQIVQVCINLGLNALDAVASNPVERPRRVTIRTQRLVRGGRPFARTSFHDSGPGIPEAARSRIFQPFFTTKGPGLGTGLGLSVSARLVEEHGGVLAFECRPDGTLFHFDLPLWVQA